MGNDQLDQALNLLSRERLLFIDGLFIDRGEAEDRLQAYLGLIRQWNPSFGLVSDNDIPALEERHVVDSLSLVPYAVRTCYPGAGLLDIGSGGGFPAIPIKCLLPHLELTLVERSARKVGFLQRVIATLQLPAITVVHGNFPECLPKVMAGCITARAIERPRQVIPAILKRMPFHAIFLYQGTTPPRISQRVFHVEHVSDAWRSAALRRGELFLISYKKST